MTVCILDRPRHAELIEEVRDAGARIRFITDGDIAGAISAAREGSEVDVLMGIGGTPEGIVAACALKCMGGAIQAKLWPRDDAEREKAIAAGHDLDRVLTTDDLVTRGQRVLRGHRRDLRRPAAGRPVPGRRRVHPVDRDAVQERHHPGDRLVPPAGEAGPYSVVDFDGRRSDEAADDPLGGDGRE